MSNRSELFGEIDASLAPPELIGVLDDIPGGEDNLLPKDGWLRPLRVEFSLWSDSVIAPGVKDVIQLILDGDELNPVDTKEFIGTGSPIDPALLFLEVPVSKLDEGVHSLIYRLWPWNNPGLPRECLPVPFTVDKTAPILATDSQLIFPPEVAPPPKQITAAYLAIPANNDQVLATLPAYTKEKVGDVITWYWERSPGGRDVAGTKTLTQEDLGKAIHVAFAGDLLRQSTNNQDYFATWRVSDRAGNTSVLSMYEILQVNIRPPTPRQHPTIKQATNTGATGVLNPFQGASGVTVVVPAVGVDPGEKAKVDFIGQGGEAGPGSILGVEASVVDGMEFAIPANVVAANVPATGTDVRKVEVRYWAGVDPQHSAIYTLTVNRFAGDSFGSVQCDKAQTGSPATLSKATVALSGANIQIEKWAYHTDSLLINVWAKASNDVVTDFLKLAPTPLIGGAFTTPLPKDYVASLPLNSQFTLYADVSLDQGFSFHPFKPMPIKLVE